MGDTTTEATGTQRSVPSRVLTVFLTVVTGALLAALGLLFLAYLETQGGALTAAATALLGLGYLVIAAVVVEVFRRYGVAPVAEQTAELQRLLDQQIDVNRRQRDFLTHLHHEVRTPVTVVLGATQLLAVHGDTLPQAEREQLREAAYRNARALSVLVDDLTLGVDEALPGLASAQAVDNWSSPRTDAPRLDCSNGAVSRPAT